MPLDAQTFDQGFDPFPPGGDLLPLERRFGPPNLVAPWSVENVSSTWAIGPNVPGAIAIYERIFLGGAIIASGVNGFSTSSFVPGGGGISAEPSNPYTLYSPQELVYTLQAQGDPAVNWLTAPVRITGQISVSYRVLDPATRAAEAG